jgi:TatD DNase family protein
MSLIDSHCHLDGKDFDADREEVIQRARDAGVETMVAIGSGDGPPDLKAGIRLAEKYHFMYATVGVHPHDASKADEATWDDLIALTAHPKVVAVAEIGLDYHYDLSPRATQQAVFARQLRIAREAKLTIAIHTREAWNDTVTLLHAHWLPGTEAPPGGIFHCFSGGPAEAEEALALGFHLSYSGIVTFPKAEEQREAVRRTPLNRLLVETDSPYLAPVPLRGRRNEPAFVVTTARKIAEIKGLTFEEVAKATSANWKRLCLQTVAKAR